MQGLPEHGHEAVMVEEVMRGLFGEDAGTSRPINGNKGWVAVDCTVGRGGHALRMGQALAARGGGGEGGGAVVLICLDVDPENLKYARGRVEAALGTGQGGPQGGKVEVRTFQANFGEVEDVLAAAGLGAGRGVDFLLADFGVSTNQLLEGRHGLSFNAEEPLDMRLDPRIRRKAADLLAEIEERDLAEILQSYAQERYAWRIARKIVSTRGSEPIKTTGQLARLVRSVMPRKWGQIDPATRTFQALRMAVNQELEAIEQLLAAMPELMNPGGRAAFLSFHSGEDRLVKQAVRDWEERHLARPLTRKPVEPSAAEIHRNARARSAKLRCVEWANEDLNKK